MLDIFGFIAASSVSATLIACYGYLLAVFLMSIGTSLFSFVVTWWRSFDEKPVTHLECVTTRPLVFNSAISQRPAASIKKSRWASEHSRQDVSA